MLIIQKRFLWLVFLIPLISLVLPLSIYGEEANEATYFVKPLLPANQRETITDYFDVQLGSEKEQVLQLEIHNNTADSMVFSTVLENALTNDHGVIEYQHDAKEDDSTLRYKLTDLAKVSESLGVEGGSIGKVKIAVKMPKEDFDGIILGGIRVSEKTSEESQKQSGISNVFSYVIPIKLWQTETIIPNKLNFQGVTIGQQNFENVINVRLQNPQANILRDLSLEAKVFQKGQEAIYEETQEAMKLAPNSSFDYPISLGTKKFKAGTYRLELTAKAEGLNETWKEDFEITGQEAKELNQEMVFKKQNNWGMYALITGFVMALFIIGCLLYRQNKSKEAMETKKMKNRKRSKKQTKKILIFLLAATGLIWGHSISAETDANNGVSDATILIKPKATGSDKPQPPSSTTSKPTTGKTTSSTRKILPQTGKSTNKQMGSLGSVIILCATTVFIKIERGKKNEK